MTNPNYTDVVFVLDRSGSMVYSVNAVTEGFNALIAEQRELPGRCDVTLYQFDHEFERVYAGVPVADVPSFALYPRGTTSLDDAIGRATGETGERLSALAEDDRPGAVIVVIMTDGLENSSEEYTPAQIKDMVNHQTDVYGWKYIFVGAEQNTILTAQDYGIHEGQALLYDPDASADTYNTMSGLIGNVRSATATGASTAGISFTDADRDKAAGK